MSDVNAAKTDKNGTKQPEAPKVQTTVIEHVSPYDVIIIGLDTKDGEDHPLYDDRIHIPLDQDRVMGYATYGIIEPITVKTSSDRKPVVIDGRQRVRYARLVWDLQAKKNPPVPVEKRITVPIMAIRGVATDAQLWGKSRQANIHDTSGGMMKAREVAKQLRLNGGDVQACARDFGKSEQWVRDMEGVATKLAPEVAAKLVAKELTMTAAIELIGLSAAEQKQLLKELDDEGKEKNVQNVKAKKAAKQGKQGASPKDKLDRIETACRKLAGNLASATKDDLLKVLDYCAKQAGGKGLAKIAEEIAAKKAG